MRGFMDVPTRLVKTHQGKMYVLLHRHRPPPSRKAAAAWYKQLPICRSRLQIDQPVI